MREVKGFVIVAAIFLIATTSLAQSILLEINTDFIVHKLKETGTFAPPDLRVELSKGFNEYSFKTSPSAPFVVSPEKAIDFGERPSAVPLKGWGIEVRKIEPGFASVGQIRSFSPLTKALPVSSFGFEVPNVAKIEQRPSFAENVRGFSGVGVADLGVTKSIDAGIRKVGRDMVPISSDALLEMKQKITAYSPLGGLETIGKFLREDSYAFWTTDRKFGLTIDTSMVSNWAVYDYRKGYISNLLTSFELGPVSASLSMDEGDVNTKFTTYGGISIGAALTSESTLSFFAGLPIVFGNLKVNAGIEYLPSTPVEFRPNVSVLYSLGDLNPYVSFGYDNATPVVNAGLFTSAFSAYVNMTVEATPSFGLNVGYTGPFGILTAGMDLRNGLVSGKMGFSSKPFGFDFMQFLVDGGFHVDSLGNYYMSGVLTTNFQLMSSYIQAWAGAYLYKGENPEISYGLEVGF